MQVQRDRCGGLFLCAAGAGAVPRPTHGAGGEAAARRTCRGARAQHGGCGEVEHPVAIGGAVKGGAGRARSDSAAQSITSCAESVLVGLAGMVRRKIGQHA